MKNRKGFTLVELLAVIVIIGIIATIGILSFSSISQSVKEKEKENVLNKIKVSAQRYCEEKEVEEVYVKTLVQEGYITGDNGIVKNPEDESKNLNCYVYNALAGEITLPEGNDETSNECVASISDGGVKIVKCLNDTCSSYENIDYNKWYNDTDLKLKVISEKVDLKDAEYKWINYLDPSKEYKDEIFKIDLRNVKTLEGQIRAIVNVGGKTYRAESIIKADTTPPTITNVNYDNTTWEAKKQITLDFIDEESGLKQYIVSNGEKEELFELNEKRYNAKIEIKGNGTYKICLIDNANNKNCKDENGKEIIIEIDRIDDIKPTCTISKTSTGTTSGVTANITCADQESGVKTCNAKAGTTSSVSGVKTTTTYKVVDNVGNEGTCSVTVITQIQKRTRTWNSCKSTHSECVGGYYDPYNCKRTYCSSYTCARSYSCSTTYACGTKCKTCYYNSFLETSCYGCGSETVYCTKATTCYAYDACCSKTSYDASCGNTAYNPCQSTKSVCDGGWNSWGAWSNVSSCSSSDSVDCQALYS